MQRLRILTFNIAHGRGLTPIQGLTSSRKLRVNLRRISALIEKLAPDVVALQEIDQNSRWAGSFDHLEYLRLHARFPYSVFGITNHREGLLHLNYGNAILSRHPIMTSEAIVFGESKIGEKGFLYAEIKIGRRLVPFVNMHLHYRSRVHRFRQVGQLMDYVAEKHARFQNAWHMPPIVCGDMNNQMSRPDATAELMRYFSLHGQYTLHPQKGRTFPSPAPQRTLDFILLPPACQEVHSEVVPAMISDHCPVVADFTLSA